MTKEEKKLSALKKGKTLMAPSGSRTSEVKQRESDIKTAFQDYIKSDNLDLSALITKPLTISIEEHKDFESAVYYINRAINNTQSTIDQEKAAANSK